MKEELTLFPKDKLKSLIYPLLLDQLFNVLVGMADTVMVSSVGEAAVSGVSLVDTLNMFFLMIFSGLATGGAIICAQFVGEKKYEKAKKSGNQLLLVTVLCSIIFLIISLMLRRQLLGLIFGNVEKAVMENALDYFLCVALSLPFLAIHNGCAALFRATGDSKTPMRISLVMNGINITGNAFCLYVLHMGVYGVAIPTLVSRIAASAISTYQIRREELPISMRHFTLRLHFASMVQILKLAIPGSLENSIFQIGKILVLGLISTLGTTAIAANAVANSVLTFQTLTEDAMGLAMITVVGQCAGASLWNQALGYMKKLMKYTYCMMWIVNIPIFFGAGWILKLYHLTDKTGSITLQLIRYNCLCGLTIWPMAFTLPNAIRACGKVMYTMSISLFSMWVFRIGLSQILVRCFGYGIGAVYLCFGIDWLFRTVAFVRKALPGHFIPMSKSH